MWSVKTLIVLLAAVSFNNPNTATVYNTGFNQTQYGHFGLLALGFATLFATFILRVSRATTPQQPRSSAPALYPPASPAPGYAPIPAYPPYPPYPPPQQ